MASTDGSYTFNGKALTSGTPQGTYCGLDSWDVKDDFKSTGANTLTYDRTDAFYKNALAILTAEYTNSSSDSGSGDDSSDNDTVDDSSDNDTVDDSSDNDTVDNSSDNDTVDNSSDNDTVDNSSDNDSEETNGYTGDKPLETYAHESVSSHRDRRCRKFQGKDKGLLWSPEFRGYPEL